MPNFESCLIEERMEDDRASLPVAYALGALLGPLGAHRLYLQYRASALAMLMLTVLGLATLSMMIGLLPLAVTAVWWVVDLVRMRQLHSGHTNRLRSQLQHRLSVG